jgi:hypothetical protein
VQLRCCVDETLASGGLLSNSSKKIWLTKGSCYWPYSLLVAVFVSCASVCTSGHFVHVDILYSRCHRHDGSANDRGSYNLVL